MTKIYSLVLSLLSLFTAAVVNMTTVPFSPPVSTLLTESTVKTLGTTSGVAVTDLPATVNPNIAQGRVLMLTAHPNEIIVGVTPDLTLQCTPGLIDDLSIIMLLQINHLLNGTRTPIVDVTPSGTRVSHVQYTNAKVAGHIPPSGVIGAYLTVTVSRPGVTDGGQYECSLSGLNSMQLLTTNRVTAVVSVLDLGELSSEIKELRERVREGAAKYEKLEEEVHELETARGVAFMASLTFDIDASSGRLALDMVTADTKGSFANGTYVTPETGNYLLVLQIAVKAGGHITADLRHNGRSLGRVIASGGSEDGQGSISVVAQLRKGEVIDVEVMQFSPSTRLLSSLATFLSGRML